MCTKFSLLSICFQSKNIWRMSYTCVSKTTPHKFYTLDQRNLLNTRFRGERTWTDWTLPSLLPPQLLIIKHRNEEEIDETHFFLHHIIIALQCPCDELFTPIRLNLHLCFSSLLTLSRSLAPARVFYINNMTTTTADEEFLGGGRGSKEWAREEVRVRTRKK